MGGGPTISSAREMLSVGPHGTGDLVRNDSTRVDTTARLIFKVRVYICCK